MSGAFELAAGAFAVVGVADVVIRTGRDLYSFLHDIADAPENISKLSERINETAILAGAARQCFQKLDHHAKPLNGPTASIESALKALKRELESLGKLLAKQKGSHKTWSKIKYALDERKIDKALESLERSKTLLANALILAGRELSALDHHETVSHVRQGFQKVGLDLGNIVHTMTTTLDSHQQALVSTLDNHHSQRQATQNVHNQALTSRLDDHHRKVLATHDVQHQALASKLEVNGRRISSIRQSQANISCGQNLLVRTSKQNAKRTAVVSKQVDRGNRASMRNHHKTQSAITNLTTKVEKLHISLTKNSVTATKSGREIHFVGERSDKIMAYLYTVQEQLEAVFDDLFSKAQHVRWLEPELQSLLGSAAQEEAARYPHSTATPFDQWSYSGDVIKASNNPRKRNATNTPDYDDSNELGSEMNERSRPRKSSKRTQTALSFNTPSGVLSLLVPQRSDKNKNMQDTEEVSISFESNLPQRVSVINIHFLRTLDHRMCPTICAQLNVFTVTSGSHRIFSELFCSGSIEDIDTALREGKISPYVLDEEGDNLCLYYAAVARRLEILDYLECQGIGISNLRHDYSLLSGFDLDYTGRIDNLILDFMIKRVSDPPTFISTLALLLITKLLFFAQDLQRSNLIWCLNQLQKLGHNCARHIRLFQNGTWTVELFPGLLRLILDAGAAINHLDTYSSKTVLGQLMYVFRDRIDSEDLHLPKTLEEVLAISIEAGVDIHHWDCEDWTPSMQARYYNCWDEWCRALLRNGKDIQEVLHQEENSWLLEDDWKRIWKEKGI
ncbi:hypothetical protein P153DRAFT_348131 [Dothidotthia symphoricarpi CBS 119687]|uniref:Fungal N-terminal domain-containing protein n=1 Tax=Dothidotthia symphoricarpi CBS 119687 TaxID=1392245 RepID=A0A6A6A439_9PLEO|nr:uncharacterized protein P153DRAFT_348131 [Dothidotthia symphoricarpi CBS 119687]KAF2125913.1 hypothetical protein P153DRAFT_348131 [Dothidotthia symphoricarpi CBS 119687]